MAAKPFFILVVYRPLGAVIDVAASKLSPWGSRAQCIHLSREARSEAEGHLATPELSARRRGPGHGTHGGVGAHFYREVWSVAIAYVSACGCTPYSLS
jgi:hypothetical protein